MSNKIKVTTTVPGNVSINLPDGQVLKIGRVLSVDPEVLKNSGVARYVEIGRIIILNDEKDVTETALVETAPVVSSTGEVTTETKVKTPAPKKKTTPKVETPAEVVVETLVESSAAAIGEVVAAPAALEVEPDPLETSKSGPDAPVINPAD